MHIWATEPSHPGPEAFCMTSSELPGPAQRQPGARPEGATALQVAAGFWHRHGPTGGCPPLCSECGAVSHTCFPLAYLLPLPPQGWKRLHSHCHPLPSATAPRGLCLGSAVLFVPEPNFLRIKCWLPGNLPAGGIPCFVLPFIFSMDVSLFPCFLMA